MILFVFAVFFVISDAQQDESTIIRNIDSNWTLTVLSGPPQANSIKNIEYAVNLPTTLHLDLLKNKVIEDPFFSANYPKVDWV